MELSGGWDTFAQCLSLDTSLAPLHFAVLWFGSRWAVQGQQSGLQVVESCVPSLLCQELGLGREL